MVCDREFTIVNLDKGENMKFIIAIITLVLTGCATGKSIAPSRSDLLSGSWDKIISASAIERNLLREIGGGLSGIQYEVSIYPVTDALIEAQETERAKKSMDSEAELSKVIMQRKSDFSSVSCFSLTLFAPTIEEAMFKRYRIKYESTATGLVEMNIRNVKGVESVPTPTQATLPWLNNSYVCAEKKLDLSKGFSIHIIPKTDWKTPAKLTWTIQ